MRAFDVVLLDRADFAIAAILRYAARVRRAQKNPKPTVAISGSGRLASFLAPALARAGYKITQVISRSTRSSLERARALARKVGAAAVSDRTTTLNADVLWLCVPDGEIRSAAATLARHMNSTHCRLQYAFHSSGALLSEELTALDKLGISIASVHPLMTFVEGSRPELSGVAFALEGDRPALRMARRIVRDLGGESFSLPERNKAVYHTWATMTSPLLVAYLITLEKAAQLAGIRREDARRMSLPIIRQTLANYGRLSPEASFSGPFIRGDAETIAKHLDWLKASPSTRDVYVALAQIALDELPIGSRKQLRRMLKANSAAKVS